MTRKVDPRLEKRLVTVNDTLQARAIRHAVFLERYKSGQVKKIVALINKDVVPSLIAELRARLENIATRGRDKSIKDNTRLEGLIRSLNGILETGIRQVKDKTKNSLKQLALSESTFQAQLVSKLVPKALDLSFTIPNVGTLSSIVTSRPMQGKILGEWWKGVELTAKDGIKKQINIGIATGESIDQIVRRVGGTQSKGFSDGEVFKLRRNAEAVVRTAVNHVANSARDETYKQNKGLIKGYKFVATLDKRTTPICQATDGKVYELEDDASPRPPLHFNCRSTTVPILKSFRELGFNVKDIPDSTRASMNGQVPVSVTYQEWLKGEDPKVQDEVLGKRRAELFRAGKFSVSEFVDKKGKTLTLKQLSNKE